MIDQNIQDIINMIGYVGLGNLIYQVVRLLNRKRNVYRIGHE